VAEPKRRIGEKGSRKKERIALLPSTGKGKTDRNHSVTVRDVRLKKFGTKSEKVKDVLERFVKEKKRGTVLGALKRVRQPGKGQQSNKTFHQN